MSCLYQKPFARVSPDRLRTRFKCQKEVGPFPVEESVREKFASRLGDAMRQERDL